MIDKLKYIEETKETMEKNTQKLAEIVEGISGIHKGKTILGFKIMDVWIIHSLRNTFFQIKNSSCSQSGLYVVKGHCF